MEYTVLIGTARQVVGVGESLPEELAAKYKWQVKWDGASGGSFTFDDVVISLFVLVRGV